MRGRVVRWMGLPGLVALLGCSGGVPTPAPTVSRRAARPPAEAATATATPAPTTAATGAQAPAAAPGVVPPAATPAAPAPEAGKPKDVVLTLKPDPNHPGQMIPAGQALPGPAAPPPKVTLTTVGEKAIGIAFYPEARAEGGVEVGKDAAKFDQRVVLSTSDSPGQIEHYYLKQYPSASVISRGKVGDQEFTNLRLYGSGQGERRAFFFVPSGSKQTKIELTMGTGK